MTKKTEAAKSAILTAARGLNINNDIASSMAALVESDRGKQRSLKETYYGDEEKGFKPNKAFQNLINDYPELWKVALRIEGLVTGVSSHAGGVNIYDKPITKTNSLMKLKTGYYITAFDLHQSEFCSDVKIDMLATEGLVRLRSCLDLLTDYGYLDKNKSLKQRYLDAIGVYNINRDNPEMWKMIWEGKVKSLFQMEQDSGLKGIKLIKPKSVEELAVLNSTIRLMAPEKGAEQPLDMWARYRKNINEWHQEMRDFGLDEEDVQWLAHHPAITDGIAESQESMMILLQEEKLGGNNLAFADRARKAVAKKVGKIFEECERDYYKNAEEKRCNKKLVDYVWRVLLAPQRGYSFNLSHTLSYSLIALQEMNLAYYYPVIFWNTANLIVDSSGALDTSDDEENEQETDFNADDEVIIEDDEDEIVDIYEPEEWEEYDYEDLPDRSGKKKKKISTVNYGKVAAAIGKFKTEGIEVTLPDINESGFTFTPNVSKNTIAYGLKGITRISNDIVNTIMANRPYDSLADFCERVKLNKLQMVALIKSGAFDNIEARPREEILVDYVSSVSDKKSRLTLQNMPGLITYDLIPSEMEFYKKLFLFNKFLKKQKQDGYYVLNDAAINFIDANYGCDILTNGNSIEEKKWDNTYKKAMDSMREYLKAHKDEMLEQLNHALFMLNWNKYGRGNVSSYEMESVGFYAGKHELDKCDMMFDNFYQLPEEPIIEHEFPAKDGGVIQMYRLNLIGGTVIDKNKMKNTVTLLTQYGVVTVKIYKNQFAIYDKQLSERQPDGTKKIVERSWFKRGTMLMIQGVRREQNFIPKKYKSSIYPVITKITEIEPDGRAVFQYDRMDVEAE